MASFAALSSLKLPKPRIFGVDAIAKALQSDKDVLASQADGFRALSAGKVSVPPVQSMGQPPFHHFRQAPSTGQTCVKSGYIAGSDYYVIKVAGGVEDNPSRGLPVNSGLMMVFSQETTRLEAILLDEGLLTEIRTAAAAALASSLFAPKDLDAIGIFGTGVQAHWQLRFLKVITPCRRVLVYGRDAQRLAKFCAEVAESGWQAEPASSAEQVARQCRLIHTVTSSRAPLLRREWIQPGTHISAIGADVMGKQELDTAIVADADLLVCDSLQQTFERGEFQHVAASAGFDRSRVLELGVVSDKPELHRTAPGDNRITVFDSSGVAVQDIMIATAVYSALLAKGLPGMASL